MKVRRCRRSPPRRGRLEWFVDGGRVNIIVSLSLGGGFVPYLLTATDSSLRRWGLADSILGIGADHIDTTVIRSASRYHAFTKNETRKVIQRRLPPLWDRIPLCGPVTGDRRWRSGRRETAERQVAHVLRRLHQTSKYLYSTVPT